MTEGALDIAASPIILSDSRNMNEQSVSGSFLKPPSVSKQKKRKAEELKCKNTNASELKKNKKKGSKTSKKNKTDNEDATESVDSGCIEDIVGEETDWPQVEAAVLEERNYVLSLTSWLPGFQWVVPDLVPVRPAPKNQPDVDGQSATKAKPKKNSRKGMALAVKEKMSDVIETKDEIDLLRERYHQKLEDLKKSRKDKFDPFKKKKERKLQRKLQSLKKRDKKNKNRERKLQQAEIFEEKHKAILAKKVVTQNKIFNKTGKLVFSKFDFSSDVSSQPKKTKNLESKVMQAIKEREMRKRLQEKGRLDAAVDRQEISAWSSALQKAQGEKVRDDVGMLQKSLKKKQKRKELSKKKWEERTAAVDKKMQDRQTKRRENIKTRKDAKLLKKFKKMKQKGHIVPGF
ncbi:surfeit locus protein [Halocaridina rubra]|uniref:Surfeit locus protein n=1 Tax=Halocaridina rubra TaxID=373956 RepID=A0AAN8X1Z4_HALRR